MFFYEICQNGVGFSNSKLSKNLCHSVFKREQTGTGGIIPRLLIS